MHENHIVVTFDLCSSSKLLEDLTLSGNVEALGQMLGHLHHFLRAKTKELNGTVYQFTGDGWILLFPDSMNGKRFVSFLTELCELQHYALHSKVTRLLESTPERLGITIGIDRGPLLQVNFSGRPEWVGRAINVACRLQSAIKDNDHEPEYKALLSKHLYEKFRSDFTVLHPVKATRSLRNIGRGPKFECMKVTLFRPSATSKPNVNIRRTLSMRVPSPLASKTASDQIKAAILRGPKRN